MITTKLQTREIERIALDLSTEALRIGRAIVWQGETKIRGAFGPVACILTGLRRPSTNEKTGAMLQTYYLRPDVHPVEAARPTSGADAAICGDCPHRASADGPRSCYVNIGTGVLALWSAVFGRRNVADLTIERIQGEHAISRADAERIQAATLGIITTGRTVRLGAYGDPASAPVDLARMLVRRSDGWTGYTHQWRRAPAWKALTMASVETPDDAAEAHRRGWRTFRGVSDDTAEPIGSEIVCPAYTHGVTCSNCGLCSGTGNGRGKAPSIRIPFHGGAVQLRSALRRFA